MSDESVIYILFPGRHHMLTNFQSEYLRNLAKKLGLGRTVKIIFAVTSSNHENTRRNPVPLYLRAMAISFLGKDLPCEVLVYPIPDVKQTDKFASYILRQVYYQHGVRLSPKNTVLACSTPPVIRLFKKLGFKNYPVELWDEKKEKYASLRPFEVIDLVVASGKKWREDSLWKKHASKATQKIYLQYGLGYLIQELFQDSLLGEDADITETRNYDTYAQSMDNIVKLKFEDIRPFVVQGKIVDAGCSTGSLIRLLAQEFSESDIIGIEAARKFYEFARMREYATPFVFFYRRNIFEQNFKPQSINTFIYSSVFHEIYSYLGRKALHNLINHTYTQLDFFGRIIIRDVVGPDKPQKAVLMELAEKDGKVDGHVSELSTYAKFFRFAKEFKPRKIVFSKVVIGKKKFIKLSLRDAYEYISKMTYVDNWDSELHEEFGFYSFGQWKAVLEKAGFKIINGSRAFHNPYIVEKKYRGRAVLYTLKGRKLVPEEYPPTNMILVGEK